MDEIVREFLVESAEGLDQLDRDLVAYERDPAATDVLDGIFRVMHTVKGTAGLLGYADLERVAHAAEDLLGVLRDDRVPADPELIDGLLGTVDAVRSMLTRIEHEGTDVGDDHGRLLRFLGHLHARVATTGTEGPDAASVSDGPGVAQEAGPEPVDVHESDDEHPGAPADGEHPGAPAEDDPAVPVADATPPAPSPAPEPAPSPAPEPEVRSRPVHVEETLRVDVRVLDDLMDLVGELVLTRNQIVRSVGKVDEDGLVAATGRLDALTSELQEGVMRTRMQPIETVWGKLPRLVRDLSTACGKQVRLEMDGQHTELDKTLIEAVRDPITHLIRNAVDHGIEDPDVRLAAGKPAEGTIGLRAHHKGGRVNIEITDDGGGIDPDRIRRRVGERGLVGSDRLAAMTDAEVIDLIFLPGLSTAEAVTAVSGRGVGMDVVRTNIERIGGRIEIDSVPGRGTTIRIGVPLTLAIVPALTVRTGPQEFAIPQAHLLELIRLESDPSAPSVEWVHDAPVHRLRGQLLPLVDLRAVLGFPPALYRPVERGGQVASTAPVLHVVVLQAGEQRFGLVVDEVQDSLEIVVKPMSALLDDLALFAGTTILGDGRVALILDVLGLAQLSQLVGDDPLSGIHGRESEQRVVDLEDRYILVEAGGERLALPMVEVARMEQVDRDRIEHLHGATVLQYRDGILELVDLGRLLDASADAVFGRDRVPVVVCALGGREFGVACERILDVEAVASTAVTQHDLSHDESLLRGAAVIDGRVVQLVDLGELAARALGAATSGGTS